MRGAVGTSRLGNADVLGNIARYAVLAFAVVAALSQLEIAPAIVNTLWTAIIGMVAVALALAFGLGARDAAGSVATGQLIKAEIQPGMQIGIDGQGGTVEQVGTVYTTIRTAERADEGAERRTRPPDHPGQPGGRAVARGPRSRSASTGGAAAHPVAAPHVHPASHARGKAGYAQQDIFASSRYRSTACGHAMLKAVMCET